MGYYVDKWNLYYKPFYRKLNELLDDGRIDILKKPILYSSCCVVDRAMMDIDYYFKTNACSRESFIYLIRNIDFVVTSVIALNENLGFIADKKNGKKLKKSFGIDDHKTIEDFRILRSMVLAHPVNTNFINDNGESSIVYLENIYPMRGSNVLKLFHKEVSDGDYLLQIGDPNSEECRSYYEPLLIDRDIKPVIEALYRGFDRLTSKLDDL